MDIGQGESAAYRLLNQGIEEGAILGAGKLSDKGGFLVRGEGGHCSLAILLIYSKQAKQSPKAR